MAVDVISISIADIDTKWNGHPFGLSRHTKTTRDDCLTKRMNWNKVHKWKPINIKLDTNCTLVSVQSLIFDSNLSGHIFAHTHTHTIIKAVRLPHLVAVYHSAKQMWNNILRWCFFCISFWNVHIYSFGARLLSGLDTQCWLVLLYADISIMSSCRLSKCTAFSMAWSHSIHRKSKKKNKKSENLHAATAHLHSEHFWGVGNGPSQPD